MQAIVCIYLQLSTSVLPVRMLTWCVFKWNLCSELVDCTFALFVMRIVWCTVKVFGLLHKYFGRLSCMPVVYVITHYKLQGRLPTSSWILIHSWEASPFVNLPGSISFQKAYIAFLVRFVFLWSYTSAHGRVPWLHGYGIEMPGE